MILSKSAFGFEMVQSTPGEMAAALLDGLSVQRNVRVVCINPHSIEVARADPNFERALRDADFRLCDGVGVALAARIFERVSLRRLTGPVLFEAVNAELGRRGGSVLFLGGSEAWNARIVERVRQEHPGVTAASFAPRFTPEFTDEDIREMQAEIDRRKPDVLWVGVGSPKQEKLLADLEGFGIAGAVGAAFDFYSGRVRRAPSWVRAAGLEWLYRLAQQPRRLGARTFSSAPRFLAMAARSREGVKR